MRYLSVCSGIEAATVGWHPLGWTPAAFSEIEAFPRAVLRHHYPDVPLHGDFTTIKGVEYGPIELLVGGTPCQSFSVAGLRGGMADGRGNLALEYIRLAHRKRARWVVWENVPGVFSSNGGDDFRCFLSGLVRWDVPLPEGGWQNSGVVAPGPADGSYGVAWRVLDAQHFGVPQRRRRVFVVGYLGDWRRAAAVLFERHSLSGNNPPRRQAGERTPGSLTARTGLSRGVQDAGSGHIIPQGCGGETAPTLNSEFGSKLGLDNQHIDSGAGLFVQDTMGTITARMFNALGSRDVEEGAIIPVAFDAYNQEDTGNVSKTVGSRNDMDTASLVAHSLTRRYDSSEDGCGRGTPLVPVHCFDARQSDVIQHGDKTGPLDTDGHTHAIAIQERAVSENPRNGPQGAGFRDDDTAYTLEARNKVQAVCFTAKDHGADASDISPTLRSGSHDGSHANGGVMPAVAFTASEQANSYAWERDVYPTLNAQIPNDSSNIQQGIRLGSAVRRLTPRECERLQGFPDDYTLIPYGQKLQGEAKEELMAFFQRTYQYAKSDVGQYEFDRERFEREWPRMSADGPRYKALGNSMAVPVMRWIGERIQAVASLEQREAA